MPHPDHFPQLQPAGIEGDGSNDAIPVIRRARPRWEYEAVVEAGIARKEGEWGARLLGDGGVGDDAAGGDLCFVKFDIVKCGESDVCARDCWG